MLVLLLATALHFTVTPFPQACFAPCTVTFTVRLVGDGEDDYHYCPGFGWDFGDGNRSFREGDCEPYGERTSYPRAWTMTHRYRSGAYEGYTVVMDAVRDGYLIERRQTFVLVR